MSKYIFTKEPNPELESPCIKLSAEVQTLTIGELVETFEQFLLGCGYSKESIDRAFAGEESP